MYSKAERGSLLASNDNPGPGSYDISSPRDCQEEYVPFRYKVGHVSVWTANQGPAPNIYVIKYRKNRIKGAAWSKMTEKKPFASYTDKFGTEGNDEFGQAFKTYADMKDTNYRIPDDGTPKLWRGLATNYYRQNDKTEDAKPIKNVNLRRYYSKSYESEFTNCLGCEKYRGPRWSKYTAARFPRERAGDEPGPGEYYVGEPEVSKMETWLESIRCYKRATSKLQRFTDDLQCAMSRNDEPGPADTAYSPDVGKPKSFNVKGTFGKPKEIEERYDDGNVESDFIDHPITHVVLQNKVPFNVGSSRVDKIPQLPGPGDYNPPQGTIQFELCKKLPPRSALYVAPFGTTQMQRPLVRGTDVPAPDTYDVCDVVCKPGPCSRAMPTFTWRKDVLHTATGSGLSPAHYDLFKAYESFNKKCLPCKKRQPFDSTGPRFALTSRNNDIPGPASYCINDDALKSGVSTSMKMCASIMKEKSDLKSSSPGPGYYNIHPLYKDAMVKAHCSHNVTLVPYPNFYPIKPNYGPPLPKVILKSFVKGAEK